MEAAVQASRARHGGHCCWIVSAAVLVFAGCAEPKPVVKGQVTLDGWPVDSGVIQFFPDDLKGPSGKPGMIHDGTYLVPDVPVGKMRVVINAAKVVGKEKAADLPNSPMIDKFVETVPAKYNTQSTLVREIKPGVNEIDFELTSK
jgi:hypothetical protein